MIGAARPGAGPPAVASPSSPVRHHTPEPVHQCASHAVLLQPQYQPAPPRPGLDLPRPTAPLDALVVPTARGAGALSSALDLSARLGVQVVALCSRRTRAAEVAALAEAVPGARVLAIDVPEHYEHQALPARTTAAPFRRAMAGRTNDLSLKRNLGLLIARLHGWSRILFLDDDITSATGSRTGLDPFTARRIGEELASRQVAGLICRSFPDNSVVCHARRLAGLPQDNFVTGGALGVNCSDQPLPFFPDIYNEDWFFFSRHAADRELAQVGEARQAPYDPFEDPARARQEEFGDLLAEGLYALFDRQASEMPFGDRLQAATVGYWSQFIAARAGDLARTAALLRHDDLQVRRARRSLRAAAHQLGRITPALCADFLRAWQADLADWEQATVRLNQARSSQDALARLGLVATEPNALLQTG